MSRTRHFLPFGIALAVLLAATLFVRSTPAAATRPAARVSVAIGSSSFGTILFDGRGYALYVFSRDRRRRATCDGACAKGWPPFLVSSRPAAGKGAIARLVGVTARADGRLQATYAGRPLYYYVGDTKPGIDLCQNVEEYGGLWLVVRRSGSPVR